MKIFHSRRARGRGLAATVLAGSMIASVLGLAPAAHADVEVFQVGCDEDALVAAIVAANDADPAGDVDSINLARKCTYEFDSPYLATDNALPIITDPLVIFGNGSTLTREDDDRDDGDDDFGTPGFRFFEVGSDFGADDAGTLTLINLTLTGGLIDNTNIFGDTVLAGGAIRVADTTGADGESSLRGERLTVKDNEVFIVDTAILTGAGGILNDGGTVDLLRSTVSDNEVTGISLETVAGGGGIAAVEGANGSQTRVRRSTVKNNEVGAFGAVAAVGAGGGIATADAGSCLVLDSSSVTGNGVETDSGLISVSAGGGLLVAGGDGAGLCTVTFGLELEPDPAAELGTYIRNSDVSKNEVEAESAALSLALGGGISNSSVVGPSGDIHADDQNDDDRGSTVTNNKASCPDQACASIGGGYAGVGGTSVWDSTTFKGNLASAPRGAAVGGGLAALDGEVIDLNEAVVTKNTAKGRFATGGGLFSDSTSTINIDASDIFKNKPNDCFGVLGC